MKQKCAEAAFNLIQDGMIIGLGGGSTISLLVQKIEQQKKQIQVVTPSQDTMDLCQKFHIPVLSLETVDKIDIAFDGCDEVDINLNALKSGGGIHTREKLVAAMAKDYILLADEGKLKEILTFQHSITIEVIRPARQYIKKCLEKLGAMVTERRDGKKIGLVISDDGNYLLEAKFSEVKDIKLLSQKLDQIPGIVGHSLFYKFATKAIIAKQDGIDIIEKLN